MKKIGSCAAAFLICSTPCEKQKVAGSEKLDRGDYRASSRSPAPHFRDRGAQVAKALALAPDELGANREWLLYRESLKTLDLASLLDLVNQAKSELPAMKYEVAFDYALVEVARQDPDAALEFFSIPENLALESLAFCDVVHEIAKSNPDKVKAWVRDYLNSCPNSNKSNFAGAAFEAISRQNPSQALAFLKEQSLDSSAEIDAARSVMREMAMENPQAAAMAAKESFSGVVLENASLSVVSGAARKDPEFALKFAESIENVGLREEAVGSVVEILLEENAQGLSEQLADISPQSLSRCLAASNYMVTKLAAKQPDILLSVLNQVVLVSSNKDLFSQSVYQLMDSRPAEVIEMLDRLPESSSKHDLIGFTHRKQAQADPETAAARAMQISDLDLKKRCLENVASVIVRQGADATLNFVESIPEATRSYVVAKTLPQIATQDLNVAADLLVGSDSPVTDPNDRQSVIPNLAERMTAADPDHAQVWLGKLPENDRPSAMVGIARQMAKTDINDLAALLGNSPRDQTWKAGVEVLITNLRESDVEVATQWQDLLDRTKASEGNRWVFTTLTELQFGRILATR